MVPRFLFLGAVLLASLSAFASSLALGPERELAPATTALRFNGVAVAIGASEDGFATVWWQHPRTFRAFVTRLDTAGRPIDALGIPLPVPLSHAAVGWNGREYIIAGISLVPDGGLVLLRVAADGTVTGPEPRTIPDALYGYDLGLTWNGRVLLLTWAMESLGKQRLMQRRSDCVHRIARRCGPARQCDDAPLFAVRSGSSVGWRGSARGVERAAR
jgi:hypothetical protein